MICPQDGKKDFDDLDCRDCKWYYQCFKMWQDGNIWGKEPPMGDNFPIIKHNPKNINKIRPITQEEVDKFRLELQSITYFDEFWRKLNEN